MDARPRHQIGRALDGTLVGAVSSLADEFAGRAVSRATAACGRADSGTGTLAIGEHRYGEAA